MFTKTDRSDIVILLVYVDDLLINVRKLDDVGELRCFRGIEVVITKQRKYALEVIFKVGLLGPKPVKLPWLVLHMVRPSRRKILIMCFVMQPFIGD